MATSQGYDPIILKPKENHTASVIFLHGLGDTGFGWSELFSEIAHPNVRYIFPTAPVAPVSLNAGMEMHSWFDIKGLDTQSPQDETGINAAANTIESLVEEEEKLGISSDRIFVGGFSQGGAASLYYGLTRSKNHAGIIALSCWLPLHHHFPAKFGGGKNTRVLQCHGTHDPLVPLTWADLSHALLKQLLPNCTLKKYNGMMHSSCDAEMREVKEFIKNCLN